MGWTKSVLLKVLTSTKCLWKGNIAQRNKFGALVCSTNFVFNPILLSRYSEEAHMMINPDFQRAWTRACEDKEGCWCYSKEMLYIWGSGWLLDSGHCPGLPSLPSLPSTSALRWGIVHSSESYKEEHRDDFWSPSPDLSLLHMPLFLFILFNYQS